MQIICCIPAFNEGKTIFTLINKIKKFVDVVIVCDDGSQDDTIKLAKKAGAVVLTHKSNHGKGKALKTLFDYGKNTKADLMITIDGDGQFLPEEIPKIIKPIIAEEADIVNGYRFDDESEMPKYRKIGNKVLDKVTNLASDLPFNDTQSGFRAYSKKAIEVIEFKTNGFGVDSEILVNASTKDLKIVEEKITVIYNTGYKTSTKSPLVHAAEVTSSLIEIIALRHPLKYLGIPGIILTVIGIILSIQVLGTFNDTRYFSIPFTLGAMGSIMLGVILLLMSVVLFSIIRSKNIDV
jgi:glycosyltransferase involved in cell wall biosynthesis